MTVRSTSCKYISERTLIADIALKRGRLPYFPDPPVGI